MNDNNKKRYEFYNRYDELVMSRSDIDTLREDLKCYYQSEVINIDDDLVVSDEHGSLGVITVS